MIDEQKTFDSYGYTSNELSKGSHKPIVVVCEDCGRIKNTVFKNYNSAVYPNLCRSCGVHQKHIDDPTLSKRKREGYEKACKNNSTIEKRRGEGLKRVWSNPKYKTERVKTMVKTHANDPTIRIRTIESRKKTYENDTSILKNTGVSIKQHYIDNPTHRQRQGEATRRRYIDNPKLREQHSAQAQGLDYKDWKGFYDGSRPHIIPIKQCTHLNKPFKGCEGHHLTKSMVVFIPEKLHKHIKHNLKTGRGMSSINAVAIQYLYNV